LLKQKKKLEADLMDLMSSNDRDVKNKSEVEKAKKRAETQLRELQAKLDEELKAVSVKFNVHIIIIWLIHECVY
jgi:predicted  nucleic acid-binding Zn-ribbon protein